MEGTTAWELADLKTGGNLADLIRKWRSYGDTYVVIAGRLQEWDVKVAPSTVWRWVARLEVGE